MALRIEQYWFQYIFISLRNILLLHVFRNVTVILYFTMGGYFTVVTRRVDCFSFFLIRISRVKELALVLEQQLHEFEYLFGLVFFN